MPWTTCKQIPPFFKGHISRIDTFSGVAHHWAIPKFLKVHYKKSLPLMNCFVFVFQAKRPGNQDRSPCPSRWFLIYGLTFWKHWSFVVCVWLSAPRSKQCLQGHLTADLAFVYKLWNFFVCAFANDYTVKYVRPAFSSNEITNFT